MFRIFKCSLCSTFIYNEETGDPEHGLAPGTKYENIPDTWSCPECGARKQSLIELSEVEYVNFRKSK